MFPDRCQTAEQCHPERYSAKDLASAVEARSFASTLRMTRPFSSEHHCGYMSPTSNIQHRTLNIERPRVGRSMFSVRCSVFDVRCLFSGLQFQPRIPHLHHPPIHILLNIQPL